MLITQLCPTLCGPMGYSPPGFSVHGILQARKLEQFAISSFRVSSLPRDQTLFSCTAARFFTIWATREAVSLAVTWNNISDLFCRGILRIKWIDRLKALRTVSAATAAKSLQLCPTLCDPIDSSPPGSPVPGILQARTLEWVAISFSNAWK